MFYVYIYFRLDGTPYYVGKGFGDRAFGRADHRIKPPTDPNMIKIIRVGSEDDAFKCERILIEEYGRKDLGTGCLRNMTNGGEGCSGRRCSEETRRKIAQANIGRTSPLKGKPLPERIRLKLKVSLLGNKNGAGHVVSEEHRQRLAKINKSPERVSALLKHGAASRFPKGHVSILSEETKAKISQSHKGKPLSPEHRQKLRDAKKRNWADPTYAERISKAHVGHITSPETRAKLSAAATAQHARKRA
jgi:NUMOD3 motif